ncbi:uncharacterized protein LOC144823579 isoform X2 [Lissotriton helveticus]
MDGDVPGTQERANEPPVTHIVSQQRETSAELQRLWTALRNASMPVAVPTRTVSKEETDLKEVLKALCRCYGKPRTWCMANVCRMEILQQP